MLNEAALGPLLKSRRTMIIHHWDTDGICCAAILKDFLEGKGAEVRTRTPKIGMYSLSEELLSSSLDFDSIVVADLALPDESFSRLAKLNKNVFVFDHHLQKPRKNPNYFNPVASGEDPELYPGATFVLLKMLGMDHDFLSVLGAVGDKQNDLLDNRKVYPIVEKLARSLSLDFSDLIRISFLVDSNYRACDEKGIADAVSFLSLTREEPKKILGRQDWIEKAERVETEVERHIRMRPKPQNGFIFYRFKSRYDIISLISRRLAKEEDLRVVMAMQEDFFLDLDRIYIRTSDPGLDLSQLLTAASEEGHISGGKRDVLGVLVPKGQSEDFIARAKKELGVY